MNPQIISPNEAASVAGRHADFAADRDRKLRGFFIFQILIPTIFIVGAWPLAKFLWNPPYVFEKTFFTADLLLLGALLCITIAVELYIDIRRLKNSAEGLKLDRIIFYSLGIAIVLLFLFGVIKAKSFTVDFPNPPGPSVGLGVDGCVWCSIWGGAFGLIWASWAIVRASVTLVELERQNLSATL